MNDVRYKGYWNLSKKKEISVIIYKDNSWEFLKTFIELKSGKDGESKIEKNIISKN